MLKRTICIGMILAILFLSGCGSYGIVITQEDVVDAYRTAGYEVWWETYEEPYEYGQIGYVQANHPDGEYIYFEFFETEEEAKAYERQIDHPVMTHLFSWIYGDAAWLRVKTYDCIVVSYEEPDLFIPFGALLCQ